MEKKYYKRLDILRAISYILVLLYHLDIVKGSFLNDKVHLNEVGSEMLVRTLYNYMYN
ncbi:MAG: hypothetical protein IJ809_03165 [Clostridia bacterium]|nr:hypothetical protein [Clostridia bacterium]